MRRVSLIAVSALAGLIGLARADDSEVIGRNDRECRRLLDLYARTFVDAIAGFNRRHAICDETKAQEAAAFDEAHRTTFRRTLGWRWDAAAARFVAASQAQADVTVSFVGPVRSGTADVGGKAVSFCRAEAPDTLEGTAKLPGPYRFETSRRKVPPLVLGFTNLVGSEHAAVAPTESGPMTPRPQIEARIAEAAALLEPRRIEPSLAPFLGFACPEARARAGLEDRMRGSEGSMDERRTFRRDPARDAWVPASEAEAEVSLVVSSPAYYGPVDDGGTTRWVCAAALQRTATASAHWQEEGDVMLSFTVPVKPDP